MKTEALKEKPEYTKAMPCGSRARNESSPQDNASQFLQFHFSTQQHGEQTVQARQLFIDNKPGGLKFQK